MVQDAPLWNDYPYGYVSYNKHRFHAVHEVKISFRFILRKIIVEGVADCCSVVFANAFPFLTFAQLYDLTVYIIWQTFLFLYTAYQHSSINFASEIHPAIFLYSELSSPSTFFNLSNAASALSNSISSIAFSISSTSIFTFFGLDTLS